MANLPSVKLRFENIRYEVDLKKKRGMKEQPVKKILKGVTGEVGLLAGAPVVLAPCPCA